MIDILKELKAQTGSGSVERKMKILTDHKYNLLLKDFFFWCLDPSINYWQSKITKKKGQTHKGTMNFSDAMMAVLNELATRNVSGNKAKALLTRLFYDLDEDSAQLLERIIIGKPDVGFNISTVNKIWPNLIYDPAYMRCKGYSPKAVEKWDFETDYIVSQIKADGMFNNLILSDDLRFETRSGEDLAEVVKSLDPQYHGDLGSIRGALTLLGVTDPVLHGELVCWRNGEPIERSKSNGMINKVKLGGKLPEGVKIIISVWDYIPLENFLKHTPYSVMYDTRFEALKKIMKTLDNSPIQIIEYKKIKSQIEAQQHFVEALQKGLEGTVLKHGSLVWKNHTSPNQLKLKNKFRFEMRVTGFTKGEGKFANTFGSMEIESECGLLKSAISGMKDKVRDYVHDNRSVFLDAIVEIEANGLFKNDDGSTGIMHPRFKEHRTDRVEADTLERIIQQEIDSVMGIKISKE